MKSPAPAEEAQLIHVKKRRNPRRRSVLRDCGNIRVYPTEQPRTSFHSLTTPGPSYQRCTRTAHPRPLDQLHVATGMKEMIQPQPETIMRHSSAAELHHTSLPRDNIHAVKPTPSAAASPGHAIESHSREMSSQPEALGGARWPEKWMRRGGS